MRLSSIKSRWHWIIIIALPLLAYASYFGKGLSIHADNLLHLYRLVALHKNVVEGSFYPRWTSELFLGFGYPLLNFYASSTYYLAELLHLLGTGYENSLLYAMFILLILAGIGMYRLAFDIFSELGVLGQMPSLLATAAYVFAPYLLFNLYVRGAIAELGAQALLPWVLWSFRRLLCSKEPARTVVWAIVSLAGLAFTHTISLLLVPPFLILYALVLLWRYRTQRHELRRRLLWFVIATASAAAMSAVFWLPALMEQQYVITQAQESARLTLHTHVWNWQTFIDSDWFVGYNDPAATSLRRMQLLLAVIGLVTVRRWNAEWVFMIGLAVAACLLVGEGALPIWRSHPLLLIIQFPWRMLTIATLPIALLTGGILTRSLPTHRPRWRYGYQVIGLALLIGIIVYVNFPRMEWANRLEIEPDQVNLTSVSQYEAITKRYGLSAFREFTPRWVNGLEFKSLPPIAQETSLSITLEDANNQALQINVEASNPSRLLFTTLFFPGWQATLDGGQRLEPYPSSDFGLLTLDMPVGEHQLSLRWEGTPLQHWSLAVTLLTLLLLGIFYLTQPSLRLLAFYPLIPLFVVVGLLVVAPWYKPPYHQTPNQPTDEGIQLLGYTTYQEDAEALYIFPYWYVEKSPTDLMMHWQLLDQAQNIVATLHSFPYFNTLRAFQWSANMLVDDAYYFPLPPGLAAGDYTVALVVTPTRVEPSVDLPLARSVGQVKIAHDVPPLPEFPHPFQVEFQEQGGNHQVALRGYRIDSEDASGTVEQSESMLATRIPDLIVAPGDSITYTLYWQSAQAIPVGYQVFNQLLDHNRVMLTQVNQPLQLSYGAPYYLWNPYRIKENRYRLLIPEDAAGGLYQPYLGIYRLDTGARFVASELNGIEIGDAIFLPPIKVARRAATPLAKPVSVRFGDAIQLESYDLALPDGGLVPRSTMTLTVQYKGLAPTTVDYTQFFHLQSSTLGMAAQFDTPPQGNGNPTSTWIAGEVIVDVIPLTIAPDAQPGRYRLSMGLYDPLADGTRLPVFGQDQQPQPDAQYILEEVEVE